MNPGKPHTDRLVVVTATTDPERPITQACTKSWQARADYDWGMEVVYSPLPEGSVPTFAIGVQRALELHPLVEIIACFHDDLLIEDDGWDSRVLSLFTLLPQMGLCGFFGATSLGSDDLYHAPYDPMQLARGGGVSNMREAELHGARSTSGCQVSVLDGFSQIGRRVFWRGCPVDDVGRTSLVPHANLFTLMQAWGMYHHAYDAALGAFAKRLGWEVWMLPIACHHLGGQTAVGDPLYAKWASEQFERGDQEIWERAHKIVYEAFRDVLPLRLS